MMEREHVPYGEEVLWICEVEMLGLGENDDRNVPDLFVGRAGARNAGEFMMRLVSCQQ